MFSSRELERATYDRVAFRFVASSQYPDHDTIASFRRRFEAQLKAEVAGLMGREGGLLTDMRRYEG